MERSNVYSSRGAFVGMILLSITVAIGLIVLRGHDHQTLTLAAQYDQPANESSVLRYAFGVDSDEPFIIKVPDSSSSAHFDGIDSDLRTVTAQYYQDDMQGSVAINTDTIVALSASDQHVYAVILVLSYGLEEDISYLSTFRYDPVLQSMQLVDSVRLGQSVVVENLLDKGDLLQANVTISKGDASAAKHSVIVSLSDQYQLTLLQKRAHY
ncbi:hypothetical protein L4C34_12930 [Vibrio profundum]|uniref:hypothetical protein n=1 Tax=Vibrio profundum TaxID=2910247 RepID=UPI003D0F3D66